METVMVMIPARIWEIQTFKVKTYKCDNRRKVKEISVMKNRMMKKLTKRIVASFFVVILAVAGMIVTPNTAKAADADTRDLAWVEYENDKFADLYENKTAPTYDGENAEDGYVFGGWYATKEGEALTEDEAKAATGKVWAKFVPSYVLSVKTQNRTQKYKEGDETFYRTDIRVVSAVDCTDYATVGFRYDVGNKQPEEIASVSCTKVFSSLKSSGKDVTPSQLMGAKAAYFISHRFTRIKEASFDGTIYIRPFWVTLDGTTVEGLGKYVHVEDGYDGYITVPVNLYEAEAIAAGVAEITYDNTKLKLKDVETGRVFEEMAHADKGASVKVVGNVKTITSNATNSNDIFVSLRFEKLTEENLNGTLKFTVTGEDFCDNLEATKELDVWNIRH